MSGLREKQEERLKSLAEFPERNPYPIVELLSSGQVTYQNPAARDAFGDLADNTATRTVVADWGGAVEALRRDPRRPLKQRVKWKGRTYEAHAHIIPERDRIRVLYVDIADRLREEEITLRFRDIVNSVEEFLTLIDRDYTYRAANDAYCRSHRLRPEALIGRKVSQIWGEKVFKTIIKGYLDRCFEGSVVCYQIWIEFPELGRRYFDVSYYPHRGDDGAVSHAVVLSRDITHVITLEERLRQTEKRDALGRVARGVVEEVEKTRRVLCDKNASGAEIAAGAERLALLQDGLKTFYESRKESKETCDVNVLLAEALDKALAHAAVKPRSARELKTLAPLPVDRATLSRVFHLLLTNAVQSFEDFKAAEPRISIETWQDGEWIHAGISDNGRGVPIQDRDRIFEPFFTRSPRRSGLGLTICRNLLTAIGGTIEIKSEPGKGTQVIVSLSLSASQKSVESGGHATAQVIAPKRHAHIAVVDDEPSVGTMIQNALSDEHDVTVFTSSREALAYFEKVPAVDLIFCDLMMPEISGMDLFAAIERSWPETARRVIFLSGGITKPEVERFLQSVPNRRCGKPLGAAALRQIVNEALAEFRVGENLPPR